MGVQPILQTNPLNRRYSGCRLPKMSPPKGSCFPNRKNHRCVQAQGQQEPGAGQRHGQKRKQARTLAGPPANQECPAWLEHASRLLLELRHHC